MKFKKKTKIVAEIPTASMPDIIFMLLIFFMVTTVLRTYEGLNVFLPQAKKIQKLEVTKRHIAHVFVSKDGLISIDDKIILKEHVDRVCLAVYELVQTCFWTCAWSCLRKPKLS